MLPAAVLPAYRQFLPIFHANNPGVSGPNAELLSMKLFCDQSQATMSECGRGLSVQLLMLSTTLAAAAAGVEGVPGAIGEGGENETGGNPGEEAKIQDTAATDLSNLEQLPADTGGASDQTLFRADARGPDEIFSGGFKAWGDNMNLAEHVSGDSQDSGYVATSKYQQSAQDCARQDCASENGLDYVYKLRGSGIDVNRALGLSPDSPFYAEHEVAIPHQVTPNAIEGVWGPGGWMDGQSGHQSMTWEEVTVPAVRGGQPVTARVRYAAGDVCVVEVGAGEGVSVRGEARDLFAALAAARRELEAHGVQLACNGARREVYPSGMQRQATQGRRAYVLTSPPNAARLPPTVDIFAVAPESSVLATVDEQREWFNRWRGSGSGKGESP